MGYLFYPWHDLRNTVKNTNSRQSQQNSPCDLDHCTCVWHGYLVSGVRCQVSEKNLKNF